MPDQQTVAFFIYAAFDNDNDVLKDLCERLTGEIERHIGRKFLVFQRANDPTWNKDWTDWVRSSQGAPTLLIPVLTPTFFEDDKTLPSLPASVLNVMQSGRSANRPFVSASESVQEQMSIPFEQVVNGSQSLKITVK